MDVCCDTCRFSQFDQGGGACKRYPPTVLMANVMTETGARSAPVGVYPPIRITDSCGEWKIKILMAGSPPSD